MSQEWKEVLNDGTELVRTCAWSPPGCHPVGCGLILTVKDGVITKVEGDPQHPISQGRLCVRCLALKDYIYHEDRVVYPMKRAKEDRGKDKWERITWDEALDMIELKVRHIWKEWGPESIFVYSGTGRETSMYCWAMSYAILMSPHQVFSLSGLSCMGPRAAVTNYILGCGYPEHDLRINLRNQPANQPFRIAWNETAKSHGMNLPNLMECDVMALLENHERCGIWERRPTKRSINPG